MSDEPTFEFRYGIAVVRGRPIADGFLVQAGSTAAAQGTANRKRDREERNRLVRIGVLKRHADQDLFVFAHDHVCSSASQAASIVKDGNASGPSLWKYPRTGLSLREFMEATTP